MSRRRHANEAPGAVGMPYQTLNRPASESASAAQRSGVTGSTDKAERTNLAME